MRQSSRRGGDDEQVDQRSAQGVDDDDGDEQRGELLEEQGRVM